MTSCKNNFLVGTAKLAKKHGVSNMVAVCPVEHDFAYSETETTWVEKRQEAEKEALTANGSLSILNTDLVYGPDASHLVHYMQQCAMTGKINDAFVSGTTAQFKPVSQDDLVTAIKYARDTGLSGQYAVRGSTPVTIRELMTLVEGSCGKQEGQTTAQRQLPLLPPLRMLEEFFFGMGIDTNMAEMLIYFNENQEEPVTGESLWEKAGVSPETDLKQFFSKQRLQDDEERLVLPTFGSYKIGYTD